MFSCCTPPRLQFFRFEGRIPLIVVAVVDALHIDLSAIHIIGECVFQKVFDFNIFYRAALHCKKIIFFIHLAPINDLMKFGFENEVELNAGAAPVALPKGVGDIHFHILLDDFIKSRLRHFINIFKWRFKVHQRSKTEVAF